MFVSILFASWATLNYTGSIVLVDDFIRLCLCFFRYFL